MFPGKRGLAGVGGESVRLLRRSDGDGDAGVACTIGELPLEVSVSLVTDNKFGWIGRKDGLRGARG